MKGLTNKEVRASNSSLADNTLIEENFDNIKDGDLPEGWSVSGDGYFEVQDGQLIGQGSSYSGARVVFGDEELRNYFFEADATFLSVENDSRWISLMFRANPDGEAPYYQYAKRLGNHNEIAYRTPENTWDIKSNVNADPAMEMGEPQTLKVAIYGDVVRKYYAGELIYEEKIAHELEQGKLGFQVDGGKVAFDNVKVTKFEAESFSLDGISTTLLQYEKNPLM